MSILNSITVRIYSRSPLVQHLFLCKVHFFGPFMPAYFIYNMLYDFLNKVLWTDESTFKRDGYLNLHNLHAWHTENPHLMREDRSQYQFKVNMWTGILNGPLDHLSRLKIYKWRHLLAFSSKWFADIARRYTTQHLQRNVVSTRWLPGTLCPACKRIFKRIISR